MNKEFVCAILRAHSAGALSYNKAVIKFDITGEAEKLVGSCIDESISAVKRAMPNDTHTRRVVIREIEGLKVEK